MRKLLEWYHTLSLDGRDYGLGSANGPYGNTRSWHRPHGTQVIGNVDGKIIEVETHDAGAILCGDYQHVLLEWLDAMRSSETHGHLLNGGPGCPNLIDYCPIESYGGAHQAVVIYPTGTYWLNTGIVLDPWYRQTATTYPIADWDAFALPSGEYEGRYPCSTGGSYPKRAHSFKPTESREMTHALLRCPVEVLLANQRGERIGRLPDGQFINQIPGGFSLAHPKEDGTLIWYFALPGEDRYEAEISGTGAGSFNLMTRHGDGPIQTYGEQPIAPGAQAHLTLDPGDPAAPLTLADGRTVSPTRQQELSASALGTVPLLLFAVGGLAGLGAFGLLLALLLQRRRAARASVPASAGSRARVGWEQGYPAYASTSSRGGGEVRRSAITFDELEREYYALKGRHAAGRLSDEQFRAEAARLRLRDQQGRFWTIGATTGTWYVAQAGRWVRAEPPRGGSARSRPVAGRRPNARPRQQARGSCLLTVVTLVVLGSLVVGGVSLVAFGFFPGQEIPLGQGTPTEILKKGGGGLLIAILGAFMLKGGFKAIITRRAVVEDDWGRRTEKRGCGAILNGLGQLFFGVVLLSGGLGLMTLALYQEVLPWLGF